MLRLTTSAARLAARAAATRTLSTAARSTGQRAWGWAAAGGVAAAGAVSGAVLCEKRSDVELPKVPRWGVPGTAQERTFIALKPDAVQRGLIGEIISRFEKRGFKLVAMKLHYPTKKEAEAHYADLSKKVFFGSLTDFFSSSPIVCMVWEGTNVVKQGRQMMGETDPQKSLPGSIRGDFSVNLGRNIIHGSDSTEAAAHEIKMWFKDEEVFNYKRNIDSWIYE